MDGKHLDKVSNENFKVCLENFSIKTDRLLFFKEKFSTLSTPEKNCKSYNKNLLFLFHSIKFYLVIENFSVDIKKLPDDHSSLKTQSYETVDPDRDSLPPQKVHTINSD